MNKIYALIIIFVTALALYGQPPGKKESNYGFEIDYKPPIYYDFYLTYPGQVQNPTINLVIFAQNDLFQFTSKEQTYNASYEVSVTIKKDATNDAVFANVWQKNIIVNDFTLTNSKSDYQVVIEKITPELTNGKYRLFLEVLDSGTGKGYRNSRVFDVYADQKFTDVKLFNAKNNLPAEIVLGPAPSLIAFDQDIKSAFELKSQQADSVIITSKLLRLGEEENRIIRQRIYRSQTDSDKLLFHEEISQKYLEEGNYLLKYRIRYREETLNLDKRFDVVWFEKPVYLYKYDLALRPMIYVLTPQEFEEADELSYDELGEWMKNYWNSKDPTPETKLNEIQVEFFHRVDEANRKYSQRFTEGWETDRGKSLILYGEPDSVEANPYAVNSKPYEIWYYDKIGTKLTFIDQYKEDNYKLVSIESIKGIDE